MQIFIENKYMKERQYALCLITGSVLRFVNNKTYQRNNNNDGNMHWGNKHKERHNS